MSGGPRCTCDERDWRVTMRGYNQSAFNGYRRTPSAYSEIRCFNCESRWRTRAAYVERLPDATWPARWRTDKGAERIRGR